MFELPEAITIHNVNELRSDLLQYLQENKGEKEIKLDAGKVEDIDASGVQLFLSLHKTLLKEGKSLELVNQSEMQQRMFQLSGASDVVNKGGDQTG